MTLTPGVITAPAVALFSCTGKISAAAAAGVTSKAPPVAARLPELACNV